MPANHQNGAMACLTVAMLAAPVLASLASVPAGAQAASHGSALFMAPWLENPGVVSNLLIRVEDSGARQGAFFLLARWQHNAFYAMRAKTANEFFGPQFGSLEQGGYFSFIYWYYRDRELHIWENGSLTTNKSTNAVFRFMHDRFATYVQSALMLGVPGVEPGLARVSGSDIIFLNEQGTRLFQEASRHKVGIRLLYFLAVLGFTFICKMLYDSKRPAQNGRASASVALDSQD